MFDLIRQFLADAEDDPVQRRWERLRRLPRGSDQALTGTTRRWLRQLPAGRRPLRLCELYPRVANRIAWCWSDVALSESMLEDLLVDRRGGRQGFAAPIVRELQRLQDFNTQQRVEPRAQPMWRAVVRSVGPG